MWGSEEFVLFDPWAMRKHLGWWSRQRVPFTRLHIDFYHQCWYWLDFDLLFFWIIFFEHRRCYIAYWWRRNWTLQWFPVRKVITYFQLKVSPPMFHWEFENRLLWNWNKCYSKKICNRVDNSEYLWELLLTSQKLIRQQLKMIWDFFSTVSNFAL